MAALTITDSNDISKLDFELIASLCDGKFHVNLSPAVFIAGGNAYVEGANVKVVSPLGVTIKDYLTSGYDIEPPMDGEVEVSIPLTAGMYQYGTYTVSVELVDSDGHTYELSKTVKICQPDKKDKTKKKGCLSATIDGDCTNGKLKVIVNTPPNHQGKTVESQENEFTLLYPTVSEVDPLEFVGTAIITQLYEGEWKLSGTVCAKYNMGDNVFIEILYDVKCTKNIKCIIDMCCIEAKLSELNDLLKTACTDKEREDFSSKIFDVIRLKTSIELAAKCGKDPSDIVTELEELLGCICTCNCNEGTPIIGTLSGSDVVLQGCGFDTVTEGETTTYTIYNRQHYIEIDPEGNNGLLSISDPEIEEGCFTKQVITVDTSSLANLVDCESVAAAFEDGEQLSQYNGVSQSDYSLLALKQSSLDEDECALKLITAPTGFAITGDGYQSAFGKMEWYSTLTDANNAAVSGDTVLVFDNTTEDLTTKAGVNYMGVGIHSIGNLTATGTKNTIKNLVIGDATIGGAAEITTFGVTVNGDITINGTAKWWGGRFLDNTKILTLASSAQLDGIYSERHVAMSNSARLANSKVYYTSVAQIAAVYADNSAADSHCVIQNCHVEATGNAIHGIATHSSLTTAKVSVLSCMGISSSGYGMYIHGGSGQDTGGHTTVHGCVGRSVTSHGFVVVSNTPDGSTRSLCQWMVSNNSGFSKDGSGIHLINGNIKHCHGYSVNASGILVGGSEFNSFNNLLTECTGESVEANGLYAHRDIYVVGGTYISNKQHGSDATVGNPIRLADPNAREGYFIAGVKTIAANTAAYAIRGTADITARISGCQFLSQTELEDVPGIDPAIMLRDVDIDYYGNIS